MQGCTQFQPELFHTVNLDDFVPQNHLLRKIDAVLDLEFIYDLTSPLYCPHNGRASIDPRLFFRMQIIGYLYRIKSDRKLCEDINLNLAYRWFCQLNLGDQIPGHWTVGDIPAVVTIEIQKTIAYVDNLVLSQESLEIYGGINNVEDKRPPANLTGIGGSPGMYDTLCRTYYLGVSYAF
ncbi:transposase [Microbulbifer sp. 2205BS26-8]|uniref:transposase n=1 Tax=Microbulbifer sp. 2205BS26-8 TaxID=3064386 RepID=UPI00273D729B|nr:transposase [Microbulbifer sp. 2205BS26-8]MDP5210811.1 transposase [Microbulbifer sp. 2205BS26-8]